VSFRSADTGRLEGERLHELDDGAFHRVSFRFPAVQGHFD
jgi:hypothetical protein